MEYQSGQFVGSRNRPGDTLAEIDRRSETGTERRPTRPFKFYDGIKSVDQVGDSCNRNLLHRETFGCEGQDEMYSAGWLRRRWRGKCTERRVHSVTRVDFQQAGSTRARDYAYP